MEGDSIEFSLIKLTENNWPDFKMYLQGYAIQIKAEDILHGTEKSPVVPDPPTEQSTIRLMSFRDRNSKLYLAILTSVTEKHRHLLRKIPSGASAWINHFESTSNASIMQTLRSLQVSGKIRHNIEVGGISPTAVETT